MTHAHNLTQGRITRALLLFALPMIAGNMLQQIYNIADTIIVGRIIGPEALAAVGSAYTMMTFINSVLIGLCMGCGALFAADFGAGRFSQMREKAWMSFFSIAAVTVLIYVLIFGFMDEILALLRIPTEVLPYMRDYTEVIFAGIGFVFIFNFFAYFVRAQGNSAVPLAFLLVSSALNIVLDLFFVIKCGWEVRGAAIATVVSQGVSALGIGLYTLPKNFPKRDERKFRLSVLGEIFSNSGLTCMQQSVMNFGILMIQGLVNSFGAVTMAAFAAAVKIDTVAYMPAQEFGNAYSLFISQNHGAGERERVRAGNRRAILISCFFCLAASAVVCVFAAPLMSVFVERAETDIISAGVTYLRIEGAFYFGIGWLMLLYGYFRGIKCPAVSLLLTVISLGTRVLLSYTLAPQLGVGIIWWSIPAGWILADITGFCMMRSSNRF